MPLDEGLLANVLKAFISRPERWNSDCFVSAQGKDCYTLSLNGSLVIDDMHMHAIEREIEKQQKEG